MFYFFVLFDLDVFVDKNVWLFFFVCYFLFQKFSFYFTITRWILNKYILISHFLFCLYILNWNVSKNTLKTIWSWVFFSFKFKKNYKKQINQIITKENYKRKKILLRIALIQTVKIIHIIFYLMLNFYFFINFFIFFYYFYINCTKRNCKRFLFIYLLNKKCFSLSLYTFYLTYIKSSFTLYY